MRFSKSEIEEIHPACRFAGPKKNKIQEYGLADAQIEVLQLPSIWDYYERCSELISPLKMNTQKGQRGMTNEKHLPAKLHSLSANYIITEFRRYLMQLVLRLTTLRYQN